MRAYAPAMRGAVRGSQLLACHGCEYGLAPAARCVSLETRWPSFAEASAPQANRRPRDTDLASHARDAFSFGEPQDDAAAYNETRRERAAVGPLDQQCAVVRRHGEVPVRLLHR